MADLKEPAAFALQLMLRNAWHLGAKPVEIAVWNYPAFILAVTDPKPGEDPLPETMFGLPIKSDPTIGDGTVELRDAKGAAVGMIVNVGGGRG
jgi:hypothetical protein